MAHKAQVLAIVTGACLVAQVPTADADSLYLDVRGELIMGGSLNLGEQVGQAVDSQSDLSWGRMGFIGGVGYERKPWQVGIDAGFGRGGLSRDRLGRVYFNSPPTDGNTVYVSTGTAIRYDAYRGPNWSIPLSMRVGWARLSAAGLSGVSEVDLLYGEAGAGLTLDITQEHSVTLIMLAQSNRVLFVELGEDRTQTKEAGTDAIFFQGGISLSYRLALDI